jgi:hypothetical protein
VNSFKFLKKSFYETLWALLLGEFVAIHAWINGVIQLLWMTPYYFFTTQSRFGGKEWDGGTSGELARSQEAYRGRVDHGG